MPTIPLTSLLKRCSKLPLEVLKRNDMSGYICIVSQGEEVAMVLGTERAKCKDDALLLTHCCNNFVELVEALEACLDAMPYLHESNDAIEAAKHKSKAALSKAANVNLKECK